MLVVSHYEIQETAGRSQPWDKTTYTENAGAYYSFCEKPELIREVLEDFKPFESQKAVQTFYELLEWLNRKEGALETNDCFFRPPAENPDDQFRFSTKTHGRLEFFIRKLDMNLSGDAVHWLYRMLSLHLQVERPDFHSAIFDIAGAETEYLELPGGRNERTGLRLCIYFNAYGDGDANAWDNLDIAIHGLFEAFKGIERGIQGDFLKFP
ncbi:MULTISPECIES: hypothetical protein [Pseudomonas syringae group]|uniref:Uncharacterized protein n=2 Tax=Pseudomonas syringae group TaxID=136849 RepID=A0ABU7NEC3_PSEVI|nr:MULTISPECIES: hypothetical protein [Pseudomonas syringae group]MBI6576846.1 hypothetical protein [Pseudomonas viridiflava]MBI6606431.1 hypothetical protein [Pseudomonas viridiflava]MBI6637487.1 hypothetical protein [Pseudomonas viridiflava]MBI6871029.1 hypothetical protein [Pseudomonas viridiflava]MEE3937889.1 hypothetical protein [Pseudomonas viridiflava]